MAFKKQKPVEISGKRRKISYQAGEGERKETAKNIHDKAIFQSPIVGRCGNLQVYSKQESPEGFYNSNEKDGGIVVKCRYCLSRKTTEYGVRRNRYNCRQRYLCSKCSRTFVVNDGFLKRKFSPDIVTEALDLWSRGLSLRQIKYHLKQHKNINVSHVTILLWLREYAILLKIYTDSLKLDLKGNWQADELVQYFSKRHNWLWNVMHKDKKYLIESKYSLFRYQKIADKVFEEAKKKGTPQEVQTDGLSNYPRAVKNAFGNKTKHVKHSDLRSKRNMNTVERLQGTCRDRLRTTRGFHSVKTAQQLWDIWPIFYNYVKPHSSLNGQTPAQACGIQTDTSGNIWKTLIEKSVKL